MRLSNFGERFSGYSGITHLMDDLNEGLLQPNVVMMGGGNPAVIPEAIEIFKDTLSSLLASDELVSSLANYDGPQGNDAFREVLASFFQKHYGWAITRENIALTHGSQSSFFNLFNSFAGPSKHGDKEVLIPLVPEYIGYSDVGIHDGLICSNEAKISLTGPGMFKYQVDFDRLEISRKTGIICVSRPTNPSGNVLTDDECRQLDKIAGENEIPLLIDNAYGTPFPNIIFKPVKPFWNENTIVCMSLSKLGLPGVRTGIIIANQDLIRYFTNLTAITSLAPGGIGPAIARKLIINEKLLPLCNEIILPFYKKQSQFAVELIKKKIVDPRLFIHEPEGSIFLWLWFDGLPITSTELYERLKKKGLLVIPGRYFFPGQKNISTHADSCIRVNYVQPKEELERGIQLLSEELTNCWGNP
jgi:valine--pyruvate aminotransferase